MILIDVSISLGFKKRQPKLLKKFGNPQKNVC